MMYNNSYDQYHYQEQLILAQLDISVMIITVTPQGTCICILFQKVLRFH